MGLNEKRLDPVWAKQELSRMTTEQLHSYGNILVFTLGGLLVGDRETPTLHLRLVKELLETRGYPQTPKRHT